MFVVSEGYRSIQILVGVADIWIGKKAAGFCVTLRYPSQEI
jgi:hypothetical protein